MWRTLTFYVFSDCALGGNPLLVGERFCYIGDDSVLNYFSIPIPSQNLSFGLPSATHAKPLWLHFWNSLVGNRP